MPGGSGHVTSNVAVDQSSCGIVPLDVELIVDRSGSMSAAGNATGGKTRIEWAHIAADGLVDQLDTHGGVGTGQRHHIGVSSYGGNPGSAGSATVNNALDGSGAASVKSSIDGLSGAGNTPLRQGMAVGASDMNAGARTTDFGLAVQHIIIILSDGRPNPDNTSASGGRPTAANITSFQAAADSVYSILIGVAGGTGANAIDPALMQSLVSGSGAYYQVTSGSDLPDVFSKIFQDIACPAHLTLVKHLAGDGNASATDWTLSAKSGDQVVLSGAGGASGDVPAGAYGLSESTGPANYDAGSWSCDGGKLDGSSVTLAAGESATCQITNTYNPPPPPIPGALVITKTLAGDLTGFAGGDFTFSVVCGDTTYDPITINLASGSKSAPAITDIPAGTECTVTETSKANPGAHASWDVVAVGQATISEDEQSTVTITNTRAYNPPSPTGSVGGETGKPHVTPPSTSTIGSSDGTTGSSPLLLIIGMAALMASILFATPRRVAVRIEKDER
jgi:hypothetical protein